MNTMNLNIIVGGLDIDVVIVKAYEKLNVKAKLYNTEIEFVINSDSMFNLKDELYKRFFEEYKTKIIKDEVKDYVKKLININKVDELVELNKMLMVEKLETVYEVCAILKMVDIEKFRDINSLLDKFSYNFIRGLL